MINNQRFEIKISQSAGKGLFAKCAFNKGDFLFKVKGQIIKSTYDARYRTGVRWLSVGFEKWLNPVKFSEWYFINHSCTPSCGIKGQVMVYAMRDIAIGEEIRIDYSTTEHDPYWKMKCSCNETTCRKIVGPISTLDESLYYKYLPYIPAYLQAVYKKQIS